MFSANPLAERRRRITASRAVTLLFVIHPTLVGLGAFLKEQPIKAAYKRHPYTSPGSIVTAPSLPPLQQTENIFIDALAQAASCCQHIRPQPNPYLSSTTRYTYHKARRRNAAIPGRQARFIHHATSVRPAIPRASPSREEYLNLVDTYRELYSTQAQWVEPTVLPNFPIGFVPKPTSFTPPLPPIIRPPDLVNDIGLIPLAPVTLPDSVGLNQSPKPATILSDTHFATPEASQAQREEPPRADVADLLRVLKDSSCTHDEAYSAYSALPSPGVSLLTESQIRLLFRRLSTIEKKEREAGLRYLSVVDDMKALDLPMINGEWNSAIAFCGQRFSHLHSDEAEKALLTWKEMEKEANVKCGNVTFNILFDMAAKAGKFVLADMIMKEMEARGLKFNRYFRVGNIYFNGLKGDGDGVRRAYRELVEAGEIVDTVVMNCVIAALISAGELASAENVYDRMKRMLSERTGRSLSTRTWQETRDLGRALDRLARDSRKKDDKTEFARWKILNEQVSIVPNVHTYAIFIEHHAWHTGDLHSVSALLNEMQSLGVTMQGRIFLKLFKGFARHGGDPYTLWTPARLNSVWNSLVEILDGGTEDVTIRKWMVIWAVRAFARCAGREWALHIWEELTLRWKGETDEVGSAYTRLEDVLRT